MYDTNHIIQQMYKGGFSLGVVMQIAELTVLDVQKALCNRQNNLTPMQKNMLILLWVCFQSEDIDLKKIIKQQKMEQQS